LHARSRYGNGGHGSVLNPSCFATFGQARFQVAFALIMWE
jgi:hypothetical protein